MKLEDSIKVRHLFEDRLTELLKLASAMTTRELELTMAKLADEISAGSTEPDHLRLKGQVLKTYYDLRISGNKRFRRIARLLYYWSDSQSFFTFVKRYNLLSEGDTSALDLQGLNLVGFIQSHSP